MLYLCAGHSMHFTGIAIETRDGTIINVCVETVAMMLVTKHKIL